jgi:rhamnosyltransferase
MPRKVMPTISIIVRCYNEEKQIGRLLAGIAEQSLKAVEIIVVDSGSTDATLSIACRHPVNVVHIAPGDFSFGRSLNRGCAEATGELLVFASAHTYPLYTDWLERLIAPFEDAAVALAYGGQRGDASSKYSERQIFARWFPNDSCLDQAHPFCNNANAAIRRSLWQQHAYDEDLTGLEDLDWAKREMLAGQKVAYVAEAVVAHVHSESATQIFHRYEREARALKQIIPGVRFTAPDCLRLFSANAASDLYHAARDGVLLSEAGSIFAFRFMQFWGTYRGHNSRAPLTDALKERFYYPRGRERQLSNGTAARSGPIDYSRTTLGVATQQSQEANG